MNKEVRSLLIELAGHDPWDVEGTKSLQMEADRILRATA